MEQCKPQNPRKKEKYHFDDFTFYKERDKLKPKYFTLVDHRVKLENMVTTGGWKYIKFKSNTKVLNDGGYSSKCSFCIPPTLEYTVYYEDEDNADTTTTRRITLQDVNLISFESVSGLPPSSDRAEDRTLRIFKENGVRVLIEDIKRICWRSSNFKIAEYFDGEFDDPDPDGDEPGTDSTS